MFLKLSHVAPNMYAQVFHLVRLKEIGLIFKRRRKDIRRVTFSAPKRAGMTLPLARGRCYSILRPFLWASGGAAEVEMDSPLGALGVKTYSG